MSYATVADLEVRLGRTLTNPEADKGEALLEDASAAIDAFVLPKGVTVAPAAAKAVVCQMVLRVFDVPWGTTQETVGGVSRSYNSAPMFITDGEKALLTGGTTGGLRTVPLHHTHDSGITEALLDDELVL
jgi:hypothetical protein